MATTVSDLVLNRVNEVVDNMLTHVIEQDGYDLDISNVFFFIQGTENDKTKVARVEILAPSTDGDRRAEIEFL